MKTPYAIGHACCFFKHATKSKERVMITWWPFTPHTILAKNLWNTYARPFPPAMLRCYCKVAWLQQHCKREGKTKGSRIFQSVSRFLSKIVVSLTVNWCKHTDFWYTSIFHLGLIEDDNKSHNFTNSHFCYVTLCYSIISVRAELDEQPLNLFIIINFYQHIYWPIYHSHPWQCSKSEF